MAPLGIPEGKVDHFVKVTTTATATAWSGDNAKWCPHYNAISRTARNMTQPVLLPYYWVLPLLVDGGLHQAFVVALVAVFMSRIVWYLLLLVVAY